MNVKCNYCNEKFKIDLKVSKLINNKYNVYFQCTKCKKVYIAYYENEKSMQIQNEINEVQKEITIYNNILKNKQIAIDNTCVIDDLNKLIKKSKYLREKKKKVLKSINKK